MKREIYAPIILAVVMYGILVVVLGIRFTSAPHVHAQNPTLTPYQFGVNNITHTACTVVPSSTQYCYASDGPYVSINGAAFVSMLGTPGPAGATGPQGPTGAQGPAGPPGTIPSSFTCSGFTITNTPASTGAALTGCP